MTPQGWDQNSATPNSEDKQARWYHDVRKMSLLRDYKLKKDVCDISEEEKQAAKISLPLQKEDMANTTLQCKFPICSELPSRSHSLKVLLQLTESYRTNTALRTSVTKWEVSKIQTSQCAWLCLNNHFNTNTRHPQSQFSTWETPTKVETFIS